MSEWISDIFEREPQIKLSKEENSIELIKTILLFVILCLIVTILYGISYYLSIWWGI